MIISSTAFSQQDTSKYCLTPSQRRFVLTQAYQLAECDSVSKSLKAQIFGLKNVVSADKVIIKDVQDQNYLLSEQLKAKSNDVIFMEKQLHVALVKNRKQRMLTYGVGILGTVTTGYLLFRK